MSETLNPATTGQIADDNKIEGISMNLKPSVPLMITISCVVVTLSFLLVGVNFLLNAKIDPLKQNIAKIEIRMDKLETGQAEIKQLLYDFKNDFKNHSHNPSKQARKNK